jgi:hypothetical protein
MSYTSQAPVAHKQAYKRPYKTRGQRREAARRKHDENGDLKFLVRVAVGVGLVLLMALAFAVQGMSE